jgi:hypothetical protein
VYPEPRKRRTVGGPDKTRENMGIKIMMPPEVMDNIASTLIAKHVLGEIVRRSVRTSFDEHYLVVVMHKGISEELPHLSFNALAKLLSCPTERVRAHLADHMVAGSARGGCKICKGASEELQMQIVEEKNKNHKGESFSSIVITMASVRSAVRR